MLLSRAIIIVIIVVGFDSARLSALSNSTRSILIGYKVEKQIFYVETVMH